MMGKIGAAMLLIGVGAVSLSGCGGGGRPRGSSCQPEVQVSWTVVDAANNVFHCEDVGATTVVVNMGGMSTSFNCNAYGGVTAPVFAGTYSTSFQLLDGNGTVLSQTPAMDVPVSGCATISVGQVDFEVTPNAPPPCGTQDVALSWSIAQASNNAPLTCAQAGAQTVHLNLGNNGYDFSCDAGVGRTTAVTDGTYPTYLQLLSPGGQVLSQTDSMNITVPRCAGVTLPDVVFAVQ
ncbi:MAG TPA: hypothetical protein VMU50_14625 [Polyangia bacterium]|nr:hypothetical protein [Polyangia bacterium]